MSRPVQTASPSVNGQPTRPANPALANFVPLSQIAQQRLTLRDLLPLVPATIISLVCNAVFVGIIWTNMQNEAHGSNNLKAKQVSKEDLDKLATEKKSKEEKEDFIVVSDRNFANDLAKYDPFKPNNPLELIDIERHEKKPEEPHGIKPPPDREDPAGIGSGTKGGIQGVGKDSGNPGILGSDAYDAAMGSRAGKGGNVIGDGFGLPGAEGRGERDGGGYGLRGDRKNVARREGGNDASEQAVGLALEWLDAHQWKDDGGKWTFNKYPPKSPMAHARDMTGIGTSDNDVAATSLALLCFLGANHHHKNEKSPYRETVRMALNYLKSQQDNVTGCIRTAASKDQQTLMYGHALATMAICEAYALSGDPALQGWAQRAVGFLESAQNKITGGWRYKPWKPADKDTDWNSRGDTSVTGWVLMALRSAQLAKLKIDPKTWELAEKWLNSCGHDGNAKYSYETQGGATVTMTAAGLLGRQFLGWGPLNPDLHKGCEYLLKDGLGEVKAAANRVKPADPETKNVGNIYSYYYIAQVFHNIEGKYWAEWNPVMRDFLVATQETEGAKKGTWTGADYSGSGGRVYATALSCLTLEIYYRYMPLYRK